ncbi:MAG: hypothetical protein AAB316_09025 [Bacteroidota bacterium]
MQTVTIELLNDQAMGELRQLERQNLLRFVLPKGKKQNLAARFEALFQRWKKETALFSSGSAITQHPAYQDIIEMGEAAVPFILIKLQEDPQHLFYALYKITGENPVPKAHAGYLDHMAADWTEWGRQKGYIN